MMDEKTAEGHISSPDGHLLTSQGDLLTDEDHLITADSDIQTSDEVKMVAYQKSFLEGHSPKTNEGGTLVGGPALAVPNKIGDRPSIETGNDDQQVPQHRTLVENSRVQSRDGSVLYNATGLASIPSSKARVTQQGRTSYASGIDFSSSTRRHRKRGFRFSFLTE